MEKTIPVFDHHQHVGWYSDGYHSPRDVWESAISAGVADIAVSSTSTCAELYKLVVREMKELKRIGKEHVHPILWITPKMIKTYGIRYMLHSKVKWEGVKMHWLAHKEWYYNKKLSRKAVDIARRLRVPMLLHTGEYKECSAAAFIPLCKNNPDVTFILAHGRPLDETILALKACGNVFVDTAFMPIEDICILVKEGFDKRILFGTDTPIDQIYKVCSCSSDYISKCISEIKETIPCPIARDILTRNYPNNLD